MRHTILSAGIAFLIALASLDPAGGGEIPTGLTTGTVDSLNACIDVAVESSESWPRSPLAATCTLLGVAPEFCRSNSSSSEYQSSEAGSQVVILFRDLDGLVGESGEWYDVHFYELEDGSFRIQRVEVAEPVEVEPRSLGGSSVRPTPFSPRPSWIDRSFDWDSISPVDWLRYLQGRTGTVVIMPAQEGWISRAHVAALMTMLDSPDSCAAVASVVSSVMEPSRSTVGTEAAFIIEGYRLERYPPWSLSTRAKLDLEEIRRWWRAEGGS